MLFKVIQSAIRAISANDATVIDIYSIDYDKENPDKTVTRPVAVWKFNRLFGKKMIMVGNHHPLRTIAENGCEAIQIMWGASELTIKVQHVLFDSEKEIVECLSKVTDDNIFTLKSQGKYYLTDSHLNFGVETAWLKLRGDYSHKEKSMMCQFGSLEMHPTSRGQYKILVWSDAQDNFLYNQYLFPGDISVVDEAEIVAEML